MRGPPPPPVLGRFQRHRVCGDAPTLFSGGGFLGGPYQELLTPRRAGSSTKRPGSYSVPQLSPQGDRCLWTKDFLKIMPLGSICVICKELNTC